MIAFCPDRMIAVLPILGMGMLGVFTVTGFLIAAVWLLNKLTGSR